MFFNQLLVHPILVSPPQVRCQRRRQYRLHQVSQHRRRRQRHQVRPLRQGNVQTFPATRNLKPFNTLCSLKKFCLKHYK